MLELPLPRNDREHHCWKWAHASTITSIEERYGELHCNWDCSTELLPQLWAWSLHLCWLREDHRATQTTGGVDDYSRSSYAGRRKKSTEKHGTCWQRNWDTYKSKTCFLEADCCSCCNWGVCLLSLVRLQKEELLPDKKRINWFTRWL